MPNVGIWLAAAISAACTTRRCDVWTRHRCTSSATTTTELFDGLSSNLFMAQVRDENGVVVSADLLMRHGERLHGHLSGSNRDDARMGSNNLMIWTATQFAIDQGLRHHLGGGVGPGDSLLKFKRSFGGRELEYAVSGLIIDDAAYQDQVESRAKECDTTSDELLASHYFPAYRGGPE
jgi:serine/alanine adding enzyme